MDIGGEFVDECRAEFLEHIADLHNKIHEPNSYSDMKIRLSDGTELFCHRNIVCGQCAFFGDALKPGRFKEGLTGTVELPADPPLAIEALIEFLYKMDYSAPPNLAHPDQALFHLDVYRIADVYQIPRLRERADFALCLLILNHWAAIIPVIPDLSKGLAEFDSNQQAECHKKLYEKGVVKSYMLLADDIWAGLLKEAPVFMNRITDRLEDLWTSTHSMRAGQWLDRLGGEHAVGAVTGRVKCPVCGGVQMKVFGTVREEFYHCTADAHCNFRAAGKVWSAALQVPLCGWAVARMLRR